MVQYGISYYSPVYTIVRSMQSKEGKMITGYSLVLHTTVTRVEGGFGSAVLPSPQLSLVQKCSRLDRLGSTSSSSSLSLQMGNGNGNITIWRPPESKRVSKATLGRQRRRQQAKGGRGNVVTSNVHVNNFSKTQWAVVCHCYCCCCCCSCCLCCALRQRHADTAQARQLMHCGSEKEIESEREKQTVSQAQTRRVFCSK